MNAQQRRDLIRIKREYDKDVDIITRCTRELHELQYLLHGNVLDRIAIQTKHDDVLVVMNAASEHAFYLLGEQHYLYNYDVTEPSTRTQQH